MKILILANNDVGLFKFRKELIEYLLNNDNEVYLSLPYGDLIEPFIKMGCVFINTPVDRRGINPITDFTLFNRYRSIIKKLNPDLIITYTIKPNIYGGFAARVTKHSYAVNITGLGTAFERKGLLRLLVIKLYRIALKKVKVVFVENSEIGKNINAYQLCEKDRIVVLNGAGVNTKEFEYQDYPFNEVFHFLFIGRVMKEKGIDELLVATKRLVDEGNNCVLDIVGPYEEDYENKLINRESNNWLKYHGYQQDVKPFIRKCDCFVLPSYHEGMANTILECASSGRPVITSNIPGCRESVIDGVSGYLCKLQDVDDLYIKMKNMLNCLDRKTMGLSGRKHMMNCFERTEVVKETISYLFDSKN